MNAALQGTDTRSIEPTPPFSFAQSMRFLDGFAPCAGDHACRPDALLTGGYADGAPFVTTVRPVADDDASEPSLTSSPTMALEFEWLEGRGAPAAVERWVRSFLSLDDDLRPLYETAEEDDAFAPVVESLYGLHHVRFATPFEAACWAALSQRTPMSVATSLKRGIVDAAGRTEERSGHEVALFPTPERVLASEAAVRDAIGHDRKERTVLEAAEAFAAADLAELGDDELRERLADVWGFGPWSSEFVALRGFGRLATVPHTERRLASAVGELYGLDGAASEAEMERLAAPYGSLAGYWAHYIRVWHYRHHGL